MNRHRLSTLGIPGLAALAALLWTARNLGELPDPVASHFALSGEADGFLAPLTLSLGLAVMALVLLLVFSHLSTNRIMSGIGGGSVIFLAALQVLLLASQRGLGDATQATLHLGTLPVVAAVALGGGLLIGVLSDPPAAPAGPLPGEPIILTPGARAVWFSSVRARGFLLWALMLAPLTLITLSVLLFLEGFSWPAFGALLGAGIPLMFLGVDVRIDARGTHWRLSPGFPRATIPHESVTAASAVELRPGDWGGWGWRVGSKGQAVLIRGGEGLRIERGKHAFHLSVNDSARGAALIDAYRRD